ncbi:uncharacterized protein RJT21DRAFT_1819 [Scheffersomyces amazonensis]|uniref:uncharacterized protein n=1 Tax=Scheffersomyces amazonensis TaxID=1078765 RepID=UPI00315D297A
MSGIQALISKFETNNTPNGGIQRGSSNRGISKLVVNPHPDINKYIEKSNIEDSPLKRSTATILKDPKLAKIEKSLGRENKTESRLPSSKNSTINNQAPLFTGRRISKVPSNEGDSIQGFEIISDSKSKRIQNSSTNVPKEDKSQSKSSANSKKEILSQFDRNENNSIEEKEKEEKRNQVNGGNENAEARHPSREPTQPTVIPLSPSKFHRKQPSGSSLISHISNRDSPNPGYNNGLGFKHNATLPISDINNSVTFNYKDEEMEGISKEMDSFISNTDINDEIESSINLETIDVVPEDTDEENPEEIFEYPKRNSKRSIGLDPSKKSIRSVNNESANTSRLTTDVESQLSYKALETSTPYGSPKKAHDIFDSGAGAHSTPVTPPIETSSDQLNDKNKKKKIPLYENQNTLSSPIIFSREEEKASSSETVAKNIQPDLSVTAAANRNQTSPHHKYITKIEDTIENSHIAPKRPGRAITNPSLGKFDKRFKSIKRIFVKKETPQLINVNDIRHSPINQPETLFKANDNVNGMNKNHQMPPKSSSLTNMESTISFIPGRPAPSPTPTPNQSPSYTVKSELETIPRTRIHSESPAREEILSRKSSAQISMSKLNDVPEEGSSKGYSVDITIKDPNKQKRVTLFENAYIVNEIENNLIKENKNKNRDTLISNNTEDASPVYRLFLSNVDGKITATSIYPKRNSVDVAIQTGDDFIPNETILNGKKRYYSTNTEGPLAYRLHKKGYGKDINGTTRDLALRTDKYWNRFMRCNSQENFLKFFEEFLDERFTPREL